MPIPYLAIISEISTWSNTLHSMCSMADVNAAPGLDLTSKSPVIGVTDGALGTSQQATDSQLVETSNGAAPTAFSQHHVTEGDTVVIAVNGEKHSFVHVKSGLCVTNASKSPPSTILLCLATHPNRACPLYRTIVCHCHCTPVIQL